MKLLLDTHILLWSAADKLPPNAETYVLNESNELYFSPVSLWEIAIKNRLNRADFNVDVHALYSGLLNGGYVEVPISTRHALAVENLPDIHKDPFDRMLISQAVVEGMKIVTADGLVAKYPAAVIFVGTHIVG